VLKAGRNIATILNAEVDIVMLWGMLDQTGTATLAFLHPDNHAKNDWLNII